MCTALDKIVLKKNDFALKKSTYFSISIVNTKIKLQKVS